MLIKINVRKSLQHIIRNQLLCWRYTLCVKWHIPKRVVVPVLVGVDKVLRLLKVI